MSSITTNLVANSAHALLQPASPADPEGAVDASAALVTPTEAEPSPSASGSLESFVPVGALHPLADESRAMRSVTMFLRRVWRDGA
jgi:hypothetical protein